MGEDRADRGRRRIRDSRLGVLAIARAEIILKAEDFKIGMLPIHNHPDDAGLIGALHLGPSWIFEAHDSILAVDIGGTNIRCGVVETRWKKAQDLSKACVWKSEIWRHADDEPSREGAVSLSSPMRSKIWVRSIRWATNKINLGH